MATPLLSVVIPTWNRAHIVSEAIESALVQKHGRVEVIVVDDSSDDDTCEVVRRSFGSRIRLLRLPFRRGAGAARNAGARLAMGQLIGFLDSDDLWLPGKLDAELSVLKRFGNAEAVVSDSQSFNEGEPEASTRFLRNGLLAATGGDVRWLNECRWLWTDSRNGVATCSITLRRSVLVRMGRTWFAEDLASCEDWEFEMRVYYLCSVVVLPEVWARVRSFDDGSRLGRTVTWKHPSREQELRLLRDRLKVIERSSWLSGLEGPLADELERCRVETARQIVRLTEMPTAFECVSSAGKD